MTTATLEHINLTVNDAKATAKRLCDLFDWRIRWEGAALNGEGYTCHVGADDFYLAVYSPTGGTTGSADSTHTQNGGLNHLGVTVRDIDAMEERVTAAGYKPHLYADYEPGRRFYFDDVDGIEFEVVSYS